MSINPISIHETQAFTTFEQIANEVDCILQRDKGIFAKGGKHLFVVI